MKKEVKEVNIALKGNNRVLLNIPEMEKSKVLLTDDVSDRMLMEAIQKLKELTVYKVGDQCKVAKAGDRVYVTPASLHNTIPVGEEFKLIINETEIVYYYED